MCTSTSGCSARHEATVRSYPARMIGEYCGDKRPPRRCGASRPPRACRAHRSSRGSEWSIPATTRVASPSPARSSSACSAAHCARVMSMSGDRPMQVVASPELVDQIRRHLAPTAHRCEVGGNVIRRSPRSRRSRGRHRAEPWRKRRGWLLGLAVRPWALSSWTSSASRRRLSLGVSGSTPWPRLKMWPGRPPARSRTCRASRATTSNGASITPGIEVALDAAVADAAPGLVEGQPPVDADDVGAGARHRLEEVRGGGPEMDRRAPRSRRPPRGCAGCRAAPSARRPGSERAPAHESKSWIICAPASTCACR